MIPPGYQTLAGLVDRKALTLRQGVKVGKEILKIVYNLHSREIVQNDLVIDIACVLGFPMVYQYRSRFNQWYHW